MSYESTIKTIENAFAYTGRDLESLQSFQNLPEKDKAYMEAFYKRTLVIEALNKEANGGKIWEPDWNNSDEYKYYSWVYFKSNPASSGFVVAGTTCDLTFTYATVGSRLCLKSRALVEYFNEQFADLLQITMAE